MEKLYKNILDNFDEYIYVLDNDKLIYKNNDNINLLKLKIGENILDNKYYLKKEINFNNKTLVKIIDITIQKEKEKELKKDYLTQLENRKQIFDYLKEIEYNKTPVSLIMGDIDLFKNINDNHGHLIGDSVLKEVADKIKNNICDNCLAGRYGGEEFTLIFPNKNINETYKIAEKIRKSIEINKFKKDINITITFGISYSDGNKSYTRLLEEADIALYEGKHLGRNKSICFKEKDNGNLI